MIVDDVVHLVGSDRFHPNIRDLPILAAHLHTNNSICLGQRAYSCLDSAPHLLDFAGLQNMNLAKVLVDEILPEASIHDLHLSMLHSAWMASCHPLTAARRDGQCSPG